MQGVGGICVGSALFLLGCFIPAAFGDEPSGSTEMPLNSLRILRPVVGPAAFGDEPSGSAEMPLNSLRIRRPVVGPAAAPEQADRPLSDSGGGAHDPVRLPLSGSVSASATTDTTTVNSTPTLPHKSVRHGVGTAIHDRLFGRPEEYGVDWKGWEARVDDAVWDGYPGGVPVWGKTLVDFEVSRDHRIRIVKASTPDPTPHSVQFIISLIMRLDGSPILAFPEGSQELIHHTYNGALGLPALYIPDTSMPLIHPKGYCERVMQQSPPAAE